MTAPGKVMLVEGSSSNEALSRRISSGGHAAEHARAVRIDTATLKSTAASRLKPLNCTSTRTSVSSRGTLEDEGEPVADGSAPGEPVAEVEGVSVLVIERVRRGVRVSDGDPDSEGVLLEEPVLELVGDCELE